MSYNLSHLCLLHSLVATLSVAQQTAACAKGKSRMFYLSPLFLCFLASTGCHSETNNKKAAVSRNKYCNFYSVPFAHTVCSVEQTELLTNNNTKLSLFWRQGNDNTNKRVDPYYTFDNLNSSMEKGTIINFAVNAGMYNENFAPIGYTVIDKKQVLSINLKEGAGNFHLMPNGVFWADDSGFYVSESKQLAKRLKQGLKPTFATQSGPMLVIKDKIHPKFNPESTSKKLRNGVGICNDGTVKLVNSQVAVNFYDFAHLYKEDLQCTDALFLDGGIASALYSTELSEQDKKSMGVMIALTEKITVTD